MKFRFSLEALLRHRHRSVIALQQEVAALEQKRSWFAARVLSIEEESAQLQEERVQARLRADVRRECAIEEFLISLDEAKSAVEEKQERLTQELFPLRSALKKAVIERKAVEKIKENHYNRWLLRRCKRDESAIR